jgi:peptidoglycan/xylan/chitin deacetylase (PgdA/CDA1 family)
LRNVDVMTALAPPVHADPEAPGAAMITLSFHGIGICPLDRADAESHLWVRDFHFLRMMDEVARRRDVALTFDDGNVSDIALVLPVLQERGLRATFFPLAGRLDDPDSVNSFDLRALRAAGMSIGSHGWAHVPWTGLTTGVERRELADARDLLSEASGGAVDSVAVPFGTYDRELLRALRGRSITRVYTSDRYRVRPTGWIQPRFELTAQDSRESLQQLLDRPQRVRELRHRLTGAVRRRR